MTRIEAMLSWRRNGLYDRMARAFYHCLLGKRPAPVFRFTPWVAIIRAQNMWRDA